ncbi:MAG: metal ABC transporter permease, partial [Bacteroidales bacterium]|nr:metal ABC transporter permease [Bacteroidales bacterium]
VFISGGITHASFGGIGIAYFAGLNPVGGAAVFAVLTGIGIEYFTKKGSIRNDSVIAMLWSLGMAIGIIFIYLTPGYAPNLMTYLFGSILTVNPADLYWLAVLSAFLILFFSLFFRPILYISFDEEFAKTQNIHSGFINYTLMVLIALTIVLNIKVAGIILLISLLTIPQNTANLFTKNFRTMILLSVVFGFMGSLTGLIISWFMNIPSGATIIFSLTVIYLLVRLIKGFLKTLKIRKSRNT